MEIKNKEIQYNVDLSETETIEVKINDNSVFNESVPEGYICHVTFMYQEVKL